MFCFVYRVNAQRIPTCVYRPPVYTDIRFACFMTEHGC